MAEVRQLLFILASIYFFFQSNLDQTWRDCCAHRIVTVIVKITDQNKKFLVASSACRI